MTDRYYVAVDVANVWKSCRLQYGDQARLDFQVLSAMVPALKHPSKINQRLVAYSITNPKQRHHSFSQVLRSFGYHVRERFLRYEKGLDKPTRSDWDVGITIDAIDQLDSYDTFVLVSGDGDFSQLLEYLKSKDKQTMVITFEKATARSLYEAADELHLLKEDVVYYTAPPTGGPSEAA